MNVSLTPRLEAMIRQKVESGLYNNASEVVREALRLMESREADARLRAALAVGQEQLDRGERVICTLELREEVFQTAIGMAKEGMKPKAEDAGRYVQHRRNPRNAAVPARAAPGRGSPAGRCPR